MGSPTFDVNEFPCSRVRCLRLFRLPGVHRPGKVLIHNMYKHCPRPNVDVLSRELDVQRGVPISTDALFAIIASLILNADDKLQTPQDVVRLIDEYFKPVYEEKGLEFKITYLTGLHDYVDGCAPVIDIKGAFRTRQGLEAPHLFIVNTREGMGKTLGAVSACNPALGTQNDSDLGVGCFECTDYPSPSRRVLHCEITAPNRGMTEAMLATATQRLPKGVHPSPTDVFVTVRQHLADPPGTGQAPLLVYPGACVSEIRAWRRNLISTQGIRSTAQGLDEDEVTNLEKLQLFLRKAGGYGGAINYFDQLRVAPRYVTLGPVVFLQHPPQVRMALRPKRPLGPENFMQHRLEVVFKRRRLE